MNYASTIQFNAACLFQPIRFSCLRQWFPTFCLSGPTSMFFIAISNSYNGFYTLPSIQPHLTDNFLGTNFFCPYGLKKKFPPKQFQGGRDIKLFIGHRVTESQHFHSQFGWVNFFLMLTSRHWSSFIYISSKYAHIMYNLFSFLPLELCHMRQCSKPTIFLIRVKSGCFLGRWFKCSLQR